MAIINSKDIRIELNKIPNKYSVDYVTNTCKETVFSEKNLAEISPRQEKLEK
jgi:hypothetical protein